MRPGLEPETPPLHWKCGVLTPGAPENAPIHTVNVYVSVFLVHSQGCAGTGADFLLNFWRTGRTIATTVHEAFDFSTYSPLLVTDFFFFTDFLL